MDTASVFVAVALASTLLLGGSSTLRDVVAVAFTLFVPGRAVVSNWPEIARRGGLELSVVFSLAILALVATTTLWAHWWHPVAVAETEAFAAAALLLLAVARRARRTEQHDGESPGAPGSDDQARPQPRRPTR